MDENLTDVHTLAKFFDRDIRTIQNWVNDGMPRAIRGKYNFINCVKWRLQKLEDENEILRTAGDEKLYARRMHGQDIKNKRDEIALKRELSQLIDKNTSLRVFSNQTVIINSKINNLENDINQEIGNILNKKQKKKMSGFFNDLRISISSLDIERYLVNEEKILEEENKK